MRAGAELERGPHHQVLETVAEYRDANGVTVTQTNSITVLATGLSYLDEGRWRPTRAEIELLDTAAVARHGPHKAIWPLELGSGESVELATADGQRFVTQVLGLSYYDAASGASVLIAELKPSRAELAAPNKLVYPDAFDGVEADLVYEYRRGSVAQEVVLRGALPDPSLFGMEPATTRFEVLTEFLDAPEPVVEGVVVRTETDPTRWVLMTEPDLTDDRLEFGEYVIGPGKAFGIGEEVSEGAEAMVVKRWEVIEGRRVLLEQVEWSGLEPLLADLPGQANAGGPPEQSSRVASFERVLPQRRTVAQARPLCPDGTEREYVAALNRPAATLDKGIVIDWELVQSQGNFTFKGDTTYLVMGPVNLSGTTTIEGGTVVKYTNAVASPKLSITGTIQCNTGLYRPAFFTAKDDNTVGETIPTSTGSPSGYYANPAIEVRTYGQVLEELRVRYAQTGVFFHDYSAYAGNELRHAQLLQCNRAVQANGYFTWFQYLALRNVLIHGAETAVYGYSFAVKAEHLTAHQCTQLTCDYNGQAYGTTSSLLLTNSVLAEIEGLYVGRPVTVSGGYNGFWPGPGFGSPVWTTGSNPFGTVGAGAHYLLQGSVFLDKGTTSINQELLNALEKRTARAPVEWATDFTLDTTLSPIVARDTDTPDLGWHYAPLDYLGSNLNLTDATLVLTNGVAVGMGGLRGLRLQNGANVVSEGTPLALNRLVRYEVVQEQPVVLGGSGSSASLFEVNSLPAVLPKVQLRFTEISFPAGSYSKRLLLENNTYYGVDKLALCDCQVHGAALNISLYPIGDARVMTVGLTNNIFSRVWYSLDQDTDVPRLAVYLRNNLFLGGWVKVADYAGTGTWSARDNLFDQTSLMYWEGVPNSHNGYKNTALLAGSTNHQVITQATPGYQSGVPGNSLGNYYLPTTGGAGTLTDLIDHGSRTADLAGLFHHTTAVDQTKEATSFVDIGFHFIALASGLPVDSDSDGTADYLEDAEGDGLWDAWEITHFGSVAAQSGSWDADGDGLTNLQEQQYGSDPAQPDLGEPIGPSSRRTGLVISEIMYHPASRGDGRNVEFVEVYNSDAVSVDLGAYGLSGDVQYSFPGGTVVPPNGFKVVAKVPADVAAVYGLSGVLGPFSAGSALPDDGGTLRLTNRWGAVLLEVTYDDEPPWPVAPDGTGHSLVLRNPSYGEADVRAWAASDAVWGSPGSAETIQANPLRVVRINEVLANGATTGFVELYNHGNADLNLTGCHLSNNPQSLGLFTFSGSSIPARGFVSLTMAQLGFTSPLAGDSIFFSDASLRVLDSVRFGAQDAVHSVGRFPDGGPALQALATTTAGSPNATLYSQDLVINEIMYHPISGDNDDEYIELYNKGAGPVDLTGWQLRGSIQFTIPTFTLLHDQYLVIARDVNHIRQRYENLTEANSKGSYQTAPEPRDRLPNRSGTIILRNASGVLVDEVTYSDGGRWGQWSDGGGSSLELIDPESDNDLAANWADSQTPSSSAWTDLTCEEWCTVKHGWGSASHLEVILEGAGECLVDNVQVQIGSGGPNLVSTDNSSFDGPSHQWQVQGTHGRSVIGESGTGYLGTKCLHLIADDRGNTGPNRAIVPLVRPAQEDDEACITLKAKWLRGDPRLLLRLHGNWLEAEMVLPVPSALGTPGASNSRRVNNAGPAIYDLRQVPVVPAADKAVAVSARLHDPQGIASFQLKYRVDPDTVWTALDMRDNGTGGDAVGGDGVYSATIPAQVAGNVVAFYLESTDAAVPPKNPATAWLGGSTPAGECLVRFGDPVNGLSFTTYRIWMTQATRQAWVAASVHADGPYPITFVNGSARAIHHATAAYRGGVITREYLTYNAPDGTICGYDIAFPKDDRLLGSDKASLDWPLFHPAGQNEQNSFWVANGLGLPNLRRRYVHLAVNGLLQSSRSLPARGDDYDLGARVYEDLQTVDRDFIEEWYPSDPGGELYKFDVWSEHNPSSGLRENVEAGRLADHPDANQRWKWPKRAEGYDTNYSSLLLLFDALVLPQTSAHEKDIYTWQVEYLVDVEQWLRVFAFEDCVASLDSFPNYYMKNMYAYKPSAGKWQLLPWDLDASSGARTHYDPPANAPLFDYSSTVPPDPPAIDLNQHPRFIRGYWRAVKDAVIGPLASGVALPYINQRDAALDANQVTVVRAPGDNPSPLQDSDTLEISSFVDARRDFLNAQLNSAENGKIFEVTTANGATDQNPFEVQGKAGFAVTTIKINGVAYPITWSSDVDFKRAYLWKTAVRLDTVVNPTPLSIAGYDRAGNQVGSTINRTITYTGTTRYPTADFLINEWMADNASTLIDPKTGSYEDWIELYNKGLKAFDLSNYTIKDSGNNPFTFPAGTIVPPGGFLLVWADDTVDSAADAQGNFHAHFKLSPSGDSIILKTPLGDTFDSYAYSSTMAADVSWGRPGDGGLENGRVLAKPTPRRPNSPEGP